ncbi:ectonucleotide pyrophosphatase/phosphodiesterase [Paludisphaera sp.]|uniref:alkaline phosphatase family protein n=1 Tax=Paludisphaera sp. TaxID=2017432 RepID=UPI00301C1120
MRRLLALAILATMTTAATAADGSDRHVVLISLDGFPASYLDDPAVSIPAIRGLRDAGASTEQGMTVSNPSVTWPNHTTLVSGVHPIGHGVIYNGVLTRAEGKPTTGNAEALQSELVRVPLLFDRVKAAGRGTAAINWPCTAGSEGIDDNFPDVRNMLNHITPALKGHMDSAGLTEKFKLGGGARDVVWTELAAHVLRERKPAFLALHLLELDSTHHQHGYGTPQGREVAAKLDALVGKVVQAAEEAGIRDKTTFFVVSDHGFINNTRTIRPNIALRDAGLLTVEGDNVESARAYVVPEGGIGLVYLANPATKEEDRQKVRELFETAEGISGVFDPADFPGLGLPDPASHPAMADMVIAAKDGYGVGGAVKGQGLIQEHAQRGSHGYISTEPKMKALFVASGAGIKPGAKLPAVNNIDVAPTAAHLLGIPLDDAPGRVLAEFLTDSK